jgi:ferredoxin-NADP reductase
LAEIGEGLAACRGIRDGDWMRISTRQGTARFVAKVDPNLADDVVIAEFGWWQACPELDRSSLPVSGSWSSNANGLFSEDECYPISGSVPLRSFRCDIERDPATESRQRPWKGYRQFRVCEITAEADGVRGVTFEPQDQCELPDYLPGQHIEIKAAIGADVVREYSLTGAARVSKRKQYSIAVRGQEGRGPDGKTFEGKMSSFIIRQLKVGDLIELTAPSGKYALPEASQQPVVLMAGGIGITPFMNLLESLPDGNPMEIWLFYSNQNSQKHAFRSRICFHAARLPGLKVSNHYTSPLPSDTLGRDFDSRDRITAAVVSEDLIARRARVYMCGPSGMMKAFAGGLVARGVPHFDIFQELFTAPIGPVADDGKTYTVTFSRSHSTPIVWTATKGPILNFAEAEGLSLPSGCRVGECESCALHIVSGCVRYLNGVESDDPSVCLTCSAVPASNLVLEA